MKALFADISERARQHYRDAQASKANERRHVLALCDAIQIAVANAQHDRANMLLNEMQAIVPTALARRRGARS
jgi:hypothetical protein